MPFPLLFVLIAGGTGALGIGKTIKAGVDNNTAKRVTEEANSIINTAKKKLNVARRKCNNSLKDLGQDKVDVLDSSMNRFIRLFEQIKIIQVKESEGLSEIKKMKAAPETIKELKTLGNFASSIASGVAGGTIGGALTAFGAYSAAGSLATASTGTAIATLNGVAASNATLAFFGGGSLTAGGLGLAGGSVVLGGLVAGPALAIMGFIVGAKASKAKNDAYANLALAKKYASELKTGCSLCDAISRRCVMFSTLLKELDQRFQPLLDTMENTIRSFGSDYSKYPLESKKNLAAATALAISIKSVLDTPILTKDGQLTEDSANIVNEFGIQERKLLPPTKKATVTRLPVDSILRQCTYGRYTVKKKDEFENVVKETKGHVRWDDLIDSVNESFGVVLDGGDYTVFSFPYGSDKPVSLTSLEETTSYLIYLYQIAHIAQNYAKQDILNTMYVHIDDVDWEALVDKIRECYGIAMRDWQLTSGKEKDGTISPNSVFEQIQLKFSSQNGYPNRFLLFANEFRKALNG